MLTRIVTFAVTLLLLLSATPALTQSDPYNGYIIQHFNDENGLPQNSVNDLLFDKDGYLWLGTQVGLVRFNGNSFKLYYPDDKPAMESDVTALANNDSTHLYFRTRDQNLYCYKGDNNHYVSAINSGRHPRPVLLNSRKQFFDFSQFLQLPSSDPGSDLRKHIFQALSERSRFFVVDSGHVYLVYQDMIYYYDSHSLVKVAGGGDRLLQYLLMDGRLYTLKGNTVTGVYEEGRQVAADGRISAEGNPLMIPAAGAANPVVHIFSSGSFHHLLVGRKLYRLLSGPDGGIRADFLVNLDFVANVSAVAFYEGLDLLIIGTHTEGFYVLRKNRFRVEKWPTALQERLSRHRFGPMALYRGKDILTDKFIFNEDGKYEPVADSIPIWQTCLYIDKKDNVWGALYNLPRRLTTRLAPLQVYPALDAPIVDYTEDGQGRLYCLTERSVWVQQADSFRRLFTINGLPGRGANESFCLVSPHRLWIGNVNGLIEYDPDSSRSHLIPELQGAHVRSIHRCQDGSVLLGTYGQGYYYYYHNRFHHMPPDRNGFLITAHCFLEDRQGMIWIPCNKGLFKVPKADLDAWCSTDTGPIYYYYCGRSDGLPTNEFNGGFNASGVITPGGFIALLTMKGTVCFFADSLHSHWPHGPIDVSRLEIDAKEVERRDTIQLPAGYNTLAVEIASPYFGNRNNLYLEYCVKGLTDEWKEVPPDGIVNLNRLDAGQYSLCVRKINGFGKDNYVTREWMIGVSPLFYKTTWFKLLSIVLGLAVVLVVVWLSRNLIAKKKEVRGTVDALEKTVQRLQESEKALLKTSKMREKLISLVIHDLRSPLRFLTMLAGDLHDNQARFSGEEMKERTYLVKKGAQDVYNFSEDFLLWVTSQKENFRISRHLFHVRPLLQELHDFFQEQVLQKGNGISYEVEESLHIYSDPHILITIIRNLVDNANKYTTKGAITITAHRENEEVVIVVADTGKGMSRQQVNAFLRNESLEEVRSGSQLGHKFILDLTQRIDGTLTIDSEEGVGTTVKIRFPDRIGA